MTQIISGTAETQLAVFNEQANNSQQKLIQLNEQSRKVELLLNDEQDMRDQVQAGGEGSVESNALALTILKTQAFAANEELVY